MTSKAEPPAAGAPRARKRRPPRRPSQPRPAPIRLVETAGPDPTTPLDQVQLAIGSLGAPHGVAGEMRLHLSSDDPEHIQSIRQVFLDGERRARRVLGLRLHGGDALIRLEGITSPEEARGLRGRVVRIAGADARPLAPGEYFLYQLIGLRVVDEAGAELGIVTDLLETGANDVFVVGPPGGGADLLLPNVPEVALEILPAEGRMVVRPPVYYGDTTD